MILAGCSDKKSSYLVPHEEPDHDEQKTEVGDVSKETFRPKLDILFVIDDSASMDTHQENLAVNIPKFTEAIGRAKFIDYHIGVITSDANSYSSAVSCCGMLSGSPTYVDRNTPDGLNLLASNILVGTDGDSTERFFTPAEMALSEPNLSGYNVGFYRPDSLLVILFITDTDDQSDGVSASMFKDFLVKLKGSEDKFFIGAAYIPKKDYATCSGESPSTTKLDDLFKMTNAQYFSLCAPDFGEKLATIGASIATKAQTMLLDRVPKDGTISIMIGKKQLPEDVKAGWSYNPIRNSIEFGPDIKWEDFDDNAFPEVNYQVNVFKDPKPKKH